MFTDGEIMLSQRHRADLRAYAGSAQAILDRKDGELVAALTEIQRLEGELAIEKAKRQSLELKLDRARRA
jgi:hypothetical protein